jgi:hypothetical protein
MFFVIREVQKIGRRYLKHARAATATARIEPVFVGYPDDHEGIVRHGVDVFLLRMGSTTLRTLEHLELFEIREKCKFEFEQNTLS